MSYFGWGLNNWGQLGIGHNNSLHQPTELVYLRDKNIVDITGGEFHSIFMEEDGSLYGAGRNDDGQLATVDFESYKSIMEEERKGKMETEPTKKKTKKPSKRGRKKKTQDGEEPSETQKQGDPSEWLVDFDEDVDLDIVENAISYPTKIDELDNIVKIFSNNHYNFAFDKDEQAYSWGLGYSYVCANGKEETVEEPHRVNPLFWRGKVGCMALGYSHGMFAHATEQWESAKVDYDNFEEYKPKRRSRKNTMLGINVDQSFPRAQNSKVSRSKSNGRKKSTKSSKSNKNTPKKGLDSLRKRNDVSNNKMIEEVDAEHEVSLINIDNVDPKS